MEDLAVEGHLESGNVCVGVKFYPHTRGWGYGWGTTISADSIFPNVVKVIADAMDRSVSATADGDIIMGV